MVDDVLREAFVVGNPALALACKDAKAFARELTAIWQRVLLPLLPVAQSDLHRRRPCLGNQRLAIHAGRGCVRRQ